jgi:hypothetical protein
MKNEIEIHAIRSRPRFKIIAQMTAEEFSSKLNLHLKNRKKILGGYSNPEISVIRLRQEKEKYWAPQLQIRVETHEEIPDSIVIRGLFGPRPAIWTLFVFSYGFGCGILLTTGLYGWIELALGIGNFWVWTNLLGLILIVGAYLTAKIGQRIARNHMDVLRTFIERVLVEEKILQ